MGIVFAIATFPGAYLGSFLTSAMTGIFFERVFGILLIIISLYLFLFRKGSMHSAHSKLTWGVVKRELHGNHYSYSEPMGVILSSVVGVVSSWLGIGGGILHVPAMTELMGIPVHIAIATSHFILAWTALVGVMAHSASVDWHSGLWIGFGAIVGAQIGGLLSSRLKGNSILRFLSLALILVGLRLIFPSS